MIDAGVGAVVGPSREKQKINKTERWAGLVTHTGHNSVLSQECVRGILTITNVGLTAGRLFPRLYDLHFVQGPSWDPGTRDITLPQICGLCQNMTERTKLNAII